MKKLLYSNLEYKNNTLYIGGASAKELTEKFGSPLYVLDQTRVIENCKLYKEALDTLGNGSMALYASKALAVSAVYKTVQECGLGVDVVSGGELFIALRAGVDCNNIYFHGNNKSDSELEYAVNAGVGCIVANDIGEAIRIERIAAAHGISQRVMLRVTPNIDPHTFKQVATGQLDSKFGTTIETGEAADAVRYIANANFLDFCGCHCHIGSQIFEEQPFYDAMHAMLSFYASLNSEGITCKELNLGGGIGVPYTTDDPTPSISKIVNAVIQNLRDTCKQYALPLPKLLLEPGRSIVADAGVTLYTVGSIKHIPNIRTYISVDGGMTDSPRYALYGAVHSVIKATNVNQASYVTATIAGKACESGDIVAEDAKLEMPDSGDLIAVLTTGAYNYSMSSNYNKLPRPAMVSVRNGAAELIVRRETYEDLIRSDVSC